MKRYHLNYQLFDKASTRPPFGAHETAIMTAINPSAAMRDLLQRHNILSAQVHTTIDKGAWGHVPELHVLGFMSNLKQSIMNAAKAYKKTNPTLDWRDRFLFLRDGAFRLDGINYTVHDPFGGSFKEVMPESEKKQIQTAIRRSR
jgi:hypothetical protein